MTVTSETKKNGPFTGPGSEFNYNFDVFVTTDVQVVKKDVTGALTTLTITTDYLVDLALKKVTLTVALIDSTEEITLKRVLPITQLHDLTNQGPWLPEDHENSFDRDTMIQLQQQEEIDRCLQVALGSDLDPDALTADFWINRPRLLAETIPTGTPAEIEIILPDSLQNLAPLYSVIELQFSLLLSTGAGSRFIKLELSDDGGSTWVPSGAMNWRTIGYDTSGVMALGAADAECFLARTGTVEVLHPINGSYRIGAPSVAVVTSLIGDMGYTATASPSEACLSQTAITVASANVDGFKLSTDHTFATTSVAFSQVRIWGHPIT